MKQQKFLKITKLLLVALLSLGGGLTIHAADLQVNADPESVADPDIDNSKRDAGIEMDKESTIGPQSQIEPFASELNFVYSSKKGVTLNLYNNETLAVHSYITSLGYLMEYLGVNAKNSGYYDVRFQGGIYALKKADVDRFIPLSKIKSFPHYVNEGGYVVHRIEANPLLANSWYLTTTLGKAPSWMQPGKKYYSFSGIYFTDTPSKLGQYTQQTNAVNRNAPYYDYYLYQPMRTKTSYSAAELNRAFNSLVNNERTKMTNTGQNFITTQNKYGTNALLMLTMGIHESNYGRSTFAVQRNNLFGVGAVDSDPGKAAHFPSIAEGIKEQGNYLSWVYADADYQTGANYYGSNLGTKSSGMNVKYASDPFWGEKIANHYARIDRMLGERDYQKYNLAIVRQGASVYRNNNGTNRAHRYKNSTSLLTYMYPVVYYNNASWTEIALEPPYNRQYVVGSRYPEGGAYYWYRGYVNANDLIKISSSRNSSAGEDSVITEGNMKYYLNGQRHIKKAEQLKDNKVIKVYEYYANTTYGVNHQRHIKKIFDLAADGTIRKALSYKDNSSGTKLTNAFEYYPKTKYGKNHDNHIQLAFELQDNGVIKKALHYKDNSKAKRLIRAYEYHKKTKYGKNHYAHVATIFELQEDGTIKYAYGYEDNSRATKLKMAYEYYPKTKYGAKHGHRIEYMYHLRPNKVIQYAIARKNNSQKDYQKVFYRANTKYGNNHRKKIRSRVRLS